MHRQIEKIFVDLNGDALHHRRSLYGFSTSSVLPLDSCSVSTSYILCILFRQGEGDVSIQPKYDQIEPAFRDLSHHARVWATARTI